MFDRVGAAMNSEPEPSQSDSPADSSAATTGTVDAGEVQAAETVEAQPEVEAPPNVEPPKAEPEAEANPYEQPDEDEPAPQDLNTLMQTDRGRQIYQSHKTLRAFSKPLEEGGIGHVPSVEQIRDYYGAYRDRILMDHDLSSADPQQAGRLIAHLFNPQRGAGAQVVASEIGPALARLNPDAYAAAATPIISNYSSALLDRFQSETDPKMREALWYAANVASHDMTGEWLAQDAAKVQQQQPADPLREQREQLAAERAQINAERQQQYQTHQATWQQSVQNQIGGQLYGELDKALSNLKSTLPPLLYDSVKQKFHDHVVKLVPTTNRYAWEVFQARVKDARQSGNTESQRELANEYQKLAAPIITTLRKKYLEEAGATVLKQSDARHAELRSIDQHKAATNGGAGAGPLSMAAPVKRAPGESTSDFNLRQLRS